MKRLAILTTSYGRPGLTKLFREYYQEYFKLPEVLHRVFEVWSPHPDYGKDKCPRKGIQYENLPITNKWLAASHMAFPWDPDYVLILGSDDFITPEYAQLFMRELDEGAHVVSTSAVYFLDAKSGKGVSYAARGRIGGGRMFSIEGVLKMYHQLWPIGANVSPDGKQNEKMAANGLEQAHINITRPEYERAVLLGVKVHETRTPFRKFKAANNLTCDPVDMEVFLPKHFPDIHQKLLEVKP